MPECVYSACICCYSSIDLDKILVCCKGGGTCICLEEHCCIAANEKPFEIGLIKQEGFIFKLGLPCCTCGLKVPDMKDLISSSGQCLCFKQVAQFPFGDQVGAPICAVCFLQCFPNTGCLQPPPGGAGAPPAAVITATMAR